MRYSVARPVCVTSEIVLGNITIILLLGSLRASACNINKETGAKVLDVENANNNLNVRPLEFEFTKETETN